MTSIRSHPERPGVSIVGPTCRATLVRRLSRFSALVQLDGQETLVHVPNSGRMRELLTPGRPCLLAVRSGAGRKTAHDLLMVDLGDRWVGVDARLPSLLIADGLVKRALTPFHPYASFRWEVPYGSSRLDFLLLGEGAACPVEVKNANRVVAGRAVFPDAPTVRGVRHLQELIHARRAGNPAAVVFVIQRDDAAALRPDEENDPLFAQTLRDAASVGVALYAWRCLVSPETILLDRAVPVELA